MPTPPVGCRGWPWTEETPPLADVRPDGAPWPALSIVTAALDRTGDLEAALRSVLLQGYPRLEYLLIAEGGAEGSTEVLSRYGRWLARCVKQTQGGLREAINRGFADATGDLLAYLSPDAILRPGALATAACAVDARRDRHVAVGRCSFIDATGRLIGVEHPSQFVSLEQVLAVWKGQVIPPPSMFWTRDAWRSCGPIESGRAVDYDLCCRLATRYRFHFVDRVLSSYRLPFDPLEPMPGERRALEETVEVGRRYWGPPWAMRYWRLTVSLATHRLDRRRRGLDMLRRSGEELRRRRVVPALACGAAALFLAPEAVFVCGLYPRLRGIAPRNLKRALARREA